tara:strand:- start:2338 stop:3273 length:936 start_codon:yes stop_codon:yes gene_type:complete
MKVVFIGTPCFALPSLVALHNSTHQVELVVTRAARPQGRGRILTDPPVAVKAKELFIPVMQPVDINVNSSVDDIFACVPDVVVVVAYGVILKERLLSTAMHGAINVHPSILPRYRGPSPIQTAIASGDSETGVTVLKMDQSLDGGAIYGFCTTRIANTTTTAELSRELSGRGADLLVRTLDNIEREGVSPVPQDNSIATFTRTLRREDGEVAWLDSAIDIYNKWRAYQPWPGLYSYVGDKTVKILDCRVVDENCASPVGSVRFTGDELFVTTGQQALAISVLQVAGKKAQSAAEFSRGYPKLLDLTWGTRE